MNKLQEFQDLKISLRYFSYEDVKKPYSLNPREKKQIVSYTKFKTNKGFIYEDDWYKEAMALIEKYEETNLFNALKDYYKLHLHFLKSEERLHKYTLECFIMRIFDNPIWISNGDFDDFKKPYIS